MFHYPLHYIIYNFYSIFYKFLRLYPNNIPEGLYQNILYLFYFLLFHHNINDKYFLGIVYSIYPYIYIHHFYMNQCIYYLSYLLLYFFENKHQNNFIFYLNIFLFRDVRPFPFNKKWFGFNLLNSSKSSIDAY